MKAAHLHKYKRDRGRRSEERRVRQYASIADKRFPN